MSQSETKENWADDCKEYLDAIVGGDSLITSFVYMTKSDLERLAYYLREIRDRKGRL